MGEDRKAGRKVPSGNPVFPLLTLPARGPRKINFGFWADLIAAGCPDFFFMIIKFKNLRPTEYRVHGIGGLSLPHFLLVFVPNLTRMWTFSTLRHGPSTVALSDLRVCSRFPRRRDADLYIVCHPRPFSIPRKRAGRSDRRSPFSSLLSSPFRLYPCLPSPSGNPSGSQTVKRPEISLLFRNLDSHDRVSRPFSGAESHVFAVCLVRQT